MSGWKTAAVAVPVIIGIGVGVLSMNPPEYTTAHVCLTIAAIILLISVGWWLIFEQSIGGWQGTFFTFIIFDLIGSLWLILMKWVNEKEKA